MWQKLVRGIFCKEINLGSTLFCRTIRFSGIIYYPCKILKESNQPYLSHQGQAVFLQAIDSYNIELQYFRLIKLALIARACFIYPLSTLHDANKLCCVHDSIVHGIYLMIYNAKHLNLLKRVRSIGKPGFRFQIRIKLGFSIERKIRKRISQLRNLFLFLSFRFCFVHPKRI